MYADDIKTANEISQRIRAGEETFPAYLVRELLESEHPIRVWRKYRGLTLQELATHVQISKSYLSQIESGTRPGSLNILKRIATELQLTLDDLV